MKRIFIPIVLALVICLVLVMPAFAQSQVFYLNNTQISSPAVGYKMNLGSMPETGTITINYNQTFTFIYEVPTGQKLSWTNNDPWVLRLATDSDWGVNGAACIATVGYVDGTGFHSGVLLTPRYYEANIILEAKGSKGMDFPANSYLAIQIKNTHFVNDGVSHSIYCGQKFGEGDDAYWLWSCLTSPEDKPTYPVPEASTAVLLGTGLLGIGGFILYHRKQSSSKV
jgi:hypothetical protein